MKWPQIVCDLARSDVDLRDPISLQAVLRRKPGLPMRFPEAEGACRRACRACERESPNNAVVRADPASRDVNHVFAMGTGGYIRCQWLWPGIDKWSKRRFRRQGFIR